jgi:hypothetical protein
MNREPIDKAWASAEFLVKDLQEALKTASPLEGLVILDLIAAAADLRRRVEQFTEATQ